MRPFMHTQRHLVCIMYIGLLYIDQPLDESIVDQLFTRLLKEMWVKKKGLGIVFFVILF